MQTPRPAHISQTGTGPARVLIVEDDPVFLHLYRNLIGELDNELVIDECSNGYSAIARMSQHLPSLVILDMKMPHLDGSVFLSVIKSKPEFSTLPIVVISAAAESMRNDHSELPQVSWFVKPIRLDALRRIIEVQLGQQPSKVPPLPTTSEILASDQIFDYRCFLSHVGRDKVTQLATAHQFCSLAPQRLAAIDEGLARYDRESLRMMVHALEGSSSTLGGVQLLLACRTIRPLLHGEDKNAFCEAGAELRDALRKFTVSLARHFGFNDF